MNPVFGILVLLGAAILWLLCRPLWAPFGEWLYNRTEKINSTLTEEYEVSNGEKGEEDNERNAECEEEN